MNLRKTLTPSVARVSLAGRTKEEVIDELLSVLVSTGKVKDRDRARQALLERERKMSTGMEHGIAIPHGKTDAVDELVACVAVSAEGVDFASIDGQPARIFVMTLSPLDRSGPHIQFLAEVSRLLRDPGRRRQVLEAGTAEELCRVLTT